jgi:hypothetical protein
LFLLCLFKKLFLTQKDKAKNSSALTGGQRNVSFFAPPAIAALERKKLARALQTASSL